MNLNTNITYIVRKIDESPSVAYWSLSVEWANSNDGVWTDMTRATHFTYDEAMTVIWTKHKVDIVECTVTELRVMPPEGPCIISHVNLTVGQWITVIAEAGGKVEYNGHAFIVKAINTPYVVLLGRWTQPTTLYVHDYKFMAITNEYVKALGFTLESKDTPS